MAHAHRGDTVTRLGKVRYSYQEKELRDEAARGVACSTAGFGGLLDLWIQNWTVRVAGAVALEVRLVCTFSLWSVPATPHGRRGSGRGFDGDEW